MVARHLSNSGEVAWAFQLVHHDLWDYDTPAQPVRFDWRCSAALADPRSPVLFAIGLIAMVHMMQQAGLPG